MKILHLNTHPYGGAFNGAYRLHTALTKAGVSSKMLVLDKFDNSNLNQVFSINQKTKQINLLNRLLYWIGIPQTAYLKKMKMLKGKKGEYEIVSFPFSDFDITRTKEYQEADIIHIHWVANFLDYNSFYSKCTKPIVITLRDLFPIQGIFHYAWDALNNQNELGEIENKMAKYKIKAFFKTRQKIQIVGISNWIMKKSLDSEIHRHCDHKTIHNCIDADKYQLYEKDKLRNEFNINPGSLVLTFISDGAVNRRKGVEIFIKAISQLENTKDIVLLTAGQGVPPVLPFYIVHRHLGSLNQTNLNKVYSIADALIFPSLEEALGNVMLEAMASGTPVIGTPAGGMLDVIKPGLNGILSEDTSEESLRKAIEKFIAIKDTFDAEKIRNYIVDNFSEQKIANQYIEIYKGLLNIPA